MINWKLRKYTEAEFISAWNSSHSKSEVARKLGYASGGRSGGGVYQVTNTAKELNLLDDHMDPFWHNRKENPDRVVLGYPPNRRSLSEILVRDSNYHNTLSLKERLIREGLLEDRCSIPGCGIDTWRGQKFPSVLDHVDGDNRNNELENLRIVCRNCDGLLPTFGARNRNMPLAGRLRSEASKHLPRVSRSKPESEIKSRSKIDWPDCTVLTEMVISIGFQAAGKSLGVSDNAVKKRLARSGVHIPGGKYVNRKN